MFRSIRRFPLMGLALIGFGFLLATTLAGSGASALGSVVGFAFFLPFLILKMLFVFFLFGMFFRFAGGGWGGGRGAGGGWGRHRRHHRTEPSDDGTIWRYRGRPMRPASSTTNPESAEWEEHLRQARREVDDLDAPYSDVDLKDRDR